MARKQTVKDDWMKKLEFGQRLREVRKQNCLSQVELAKMLGFHSITVSRWERSADLPGIKAVVQLASLFDVSIDYLLGLSTTMKTFAADHQAGSVGQEHGQSHRAQEDDGGG